MVEGFIMLFRTVCKLQFENCSLLEFHSTVFQLELALESELERETTHKKTPQCLSRTRGWLTLKRQVLLGYCSRDVRYQHLFTYSFLGTGHELRASCTLSTLPLMYTPSSESRVKSQPQWGSVFSCLKDSGVPESRAEESGIMKGRGRRLSQEWQLVCW